MGKEIKISAATVSPELTAAASGMIVSLFGGYFRVNGFGGYTFADGRTIEESATVWNIAAAESVNVRRAVSWFARAYCKAGNQESVYFADESGLAYLADADGRLNAI